MRAPPGSSPKWRLMGDLSIALPGGGPIGPLGKKPLALLAYLALTAERVSRAELASLLWPSPNPSQSRHNLRQCIHALRKVFGADFDSLIDVSDNWVSLNHETVEIDALEILRIDSGRRASAREVIDLCRGPFLRALSTEAQPFDDWLEVQRERLGVAMRRIVSAAHDSANKSGQTSQAANLRMILETMSIAEGREDQPGTWSLLTRRFSRQRRPVRNLIIGTTGAVVLFLAVFGAWEASFTVRDFIRETILGQRVEPRRIAVLPFTSRNGTVEERSLAGGVTQGVNYALYAVSARELLVVTQIAEAREMDPLQRLDVANNLGVQYLISGAVEVDAGVVRVFADCLDAQTRNVIWRQQFDMPIARAFKLQDEITLEILKQLDIHLNTSDRNRIQYLDDTRDLHAWMAAADGVRYLIRVRRQEVDLAYARYKKALEIDADYVSARRGLAWVSVLRVRLGWAADPAKELLDAKNHLSIVLRKRPDDALTRSLHGAILLLEEKYDEAVAAGEFAVEMLPGSADATAVLAHTLTYVGETERALDLIDRAEELSPMAPGWYRWTRGRALRLSGRFDEAVLVLERDLGTTEPTLVHLVELTAAYSAAGNKPAARRVARQIRSIAPEFSASEWLAHPRIRDAEAQSREFEYLSAAGL